jgi:hypothetical protein
MSALLGQMTSIAPLHPEYVTVLLGGGDVCFGSTSTTDFAARFRAGMNALFATSPSSHVLVASIWNFESLRSGVLAANPSATFPFCGSFFNASTSDRATIMNRVAQYNAALAAECATYANCLYDGDALFNHVWSAGEVSTIDNFHPSVAGQEMISQVLFDAGYSWVAGPPDKDACKNGGFASYVDAIGHAFKNQGDCVSYVGTNGRNPGDG